MWCYYQNLEISCNGLCFDCPNNNILQEFFYQCPNCHGKFIGPVYKQISAIDCKDLGGFPKYIYVCPFCNKEMKGLL